MNAGGMFAGCLRRVRQRASRQGHGNGQGPLSLLLSSSTPQRAASTSVSGKAVAAAGEMLRTAVNGGQPRVRLPPVLFTGMEIFRAGSPLQDRRFFSSTTSAAAAAAAAAVLAPRSFLVAGVLQKADSCSASYYHKEPACCYKFGAASRIRSINCHQISCSSSRLLSASENKSTEPLLARKYHSYTGIRAHCAEANANNTALSFATPKVQQPKNVSKRRPFSTYDDKWREKSGAVLASGKSFDVQSSMQGRGQVDFDAADVDQDGIVKFKELVDYYEKLREGQTEQLNKNIQFSFPLSADDADSLLDDGNLRVSINGISYTVQLKSEGPSEKLMERTLADLAKLKAQLEPLNMQKERLDRIARYHAKRLLWISIGYLIVQSAVVAKLTFFSRFGWDVMEPICYFITFYVGVGGLLFFQFSNLDYSYPALAIWITRRRQNQLYAENGFDIDKHRALCAQIRKAEVQLRSMTTPSVLAAQSLGIDAAKILSPNPNSGGDGYTSGDDEMSQMASQMIGRSDANLG